MKKLIYLLALISLTAISCGMQATWPAVLPTTYQQVVLPMATVPHVTAVSTNVEKVHTDAHVYTTTAPLHIRSCAGVDCDVLAYLPAEASVDVIAAGISGPGCAGAEWYAIEAGGVAGFVCSLYVEVR